MKLTFHDCLKLIGSIFALYLGIRYWDNAAELIKLVAGASVPLVIGGCIAYVVNILMRSYERYFPTNQALARMRRPVCMAGAFLTLVAVVTVVIWLILPQLVSCFKLIAAEIPDFMRGVLALADQWELLSDDLLAKLAAINWEDLLKQAFDVIRSGLGGVMDVVVNTVSSVFSGIVTTLVAVIFSIYLLADKESLGSQFHRVAKGYLPADWYKNLCYILRVLNDCFHRYIVGQCIEAVILGTLCALGMMLLKLPYAAMVGALVAFTALIPVAGAYIGAGVGAFMILTVDPIKALIFLVFLVILQQFEGNLIYPRVVGSSMGLPGIWVLAAVTVGGGVMGVAGMLLGVPLAAAAYRIIRHDVRRREAQPPKPAPESIAEAAPEAIPEPAADTPPVSAPVSAPKVAPRKSNKKKRK